MASGNACCNPWVTEESFLIFWCSQDYLRVIKALPFWFCFKDDSEPLFRHVTEPGLLHNEFWTHLLQQCKHSCILRNWQVMTSRSAHQFLMDPQGSRVHCNASAQLKNPFVVTCQKHLASLSAGDSCSLVHQVCSPLDTWTTWIDLGIAKALQRSATSLGEKCYVINLPFRPLLFQLMLWQNVPKRLKKKEKKKGRNQKDAIY